ncbi:Uncharacterized protein dnm_062150 [Desulfonema magnum]|uniref:Uncharacterized protein n=1 Tax=Desulfonema magnum TaxID=45655 RepID=A0A975BQT4_9BACT|nr:Uncharacterized protein dnm_062150 [Desulfonema magnum]
MSGSLTTKYERTFNFSHFRHFHINGHELPVTTKNESFAVFPDT